MVLPRDHALSLSRRGLYAQALPVLREALSNDPQDIELLAAGSECFLNQGKVADAIQFMERILDLAPALESFQSARLVWSYFDPHLSDQQIFDRHLQWARRLDSLKALVHPHANTPDPDRRLNLGYLGSTIRSNVTMALLGPILELHDRGRFQIFCYNNTPQDDEVTARTRQIVDHWRDIHSLDDTAVDRLIRTDAIDVLIDVDLHLPPNRIRLLARKPAPVQIAALQYPGTSGLTAIDYVLADSHMLTPGCEQFFTEKLLPLQTLWLFRPRGPSHPAETDAYRLTEPPAIASGQITFGSLNNAPKLNRELLLTWKQILDATPGSRLLLQVKGSTGGRVELLDECRLTSPQVQVIDSMPQAAYMKTYQQIDIALDPFPYGGGGGTAFDALWMGVPLVTLAGQRPTSRYGTSILTNLGHPEWIAGTSEHYVRIATELAQHPAHLAERRANLRHEMRSSILMDERRYVSILENRVRSAWTTWCAGVQGA